MADSSPSPNAPPPEQPGLRLAIREEGTAVSAYIARHDTMLGCEIIGHIKTEALRADPELRELFVELMRCSMTAIIKKRGGGR